MKNQEKTKIKIKTTIESLKNLFNEHIYSPIVGK
jgi:hypothetical protein